MWKLIVAGIVSVLALSATGLQAEETVEERDAGILDSLTKALEGEWSRVSVIAIACRECTGPNFVLGAVIDKGEQGNPVKLYERNDEQKPFLKNYNDPRNHTEMDWNIFGKEETTAFLKEAAGHFSTAIQERRPAERFPNAAALRKYVLENPEFKKHVQAKSTLDIEIVVERVDGEVESFHENFAGSGNKFCQWLVDRVKGNAQE